MEMNDEFYFMFDVLISSKWKCCSPHFQVNSTEITQLQRSGKIKMAGVIFTASPKIGLKYIIPIMP